METAKGDLEREIGEKQSMEKRLKKATFEFGEKKESLERQISKLTEELNFVKASIAKAKSDPNSLSIPNVNEKVLKENLETLEGKFKEVREKYSLKSKCFEELEFENQQMKLTITGLKSEVHNLAESSLNERKERHKLEMQLIEIKNRFAETQISAKVHEDRVKNLSTENESLKNENARYEESWKTEKRRSVALEREIEQHMYLANSKEKETVETITSLSKQTTALRNENESLVLKLDALVSEHNSRLAKETKEVSNLQQRLRVMENREMDLTMCLDDVQKKLNFYKEKLARRELDNPLKSQLRDRLIMLVRSLRVVKEGVEAEAFAVRQDMASYYAIILKQMEIYFQSVKPKMIRKTIEIQNAKFEHQQKKLNESDKIENLHVMSSVGTFGGGLPMHHFSKQTDGNEANTSSFLQQQLQGQYQQQEHQYQKAKQLSDLNLAQLNNQINQINMMHQERLSAINQAVLMSSRGGENSQEADQIKLLTSMSHNAPKAQNQIGHLGTSLNIAGGNKPVNLLSQFQINVGANPKMGGGSVSGLSTAVPTPKSGYGVQVGPFDSGQMNHEIPTQGTPSYSVKTSKMPANESLENYLSQMKQPNLISRVALEPVPLKDVTTGFNNLRPIGSALKKNPVESTPVNPKKDLSILTDFNHLSSLENKTHSKFNVGLGGSYTQSNITTPARRLNPLESGAAAYDSLKEKIDFEKIEKESQEIYKRIHMLKNKEIV